MRARSQPVARSISCPLFCFVDLTIKNGKNGAQVALHRFDGLRIQCRSRYGAKLAALAVIVDLLARAVDCVLLGIKQLLHVHDQLDLASLVNAISGAVLGRMQKLELALPITE